MKSEVTQLRGLFRQRHHELGDDLSPAASLIEMVCEHVQQHDIKAISMVDLVSQDDELEEGQ
eukprot:680034-Amphidinium_carterae.1